MKSNKYLIISQSTDKGLNKKLANYVEDVLINEHSANCKYRNSDEFVESDLEMDRIVFIIPEWNGTYPYLFKQIVDNSGWPSKLSGKKTLLIGTSNGKFGNVMGVNHFEFTLNYVGSSVFGKKVYIPKLTENIGNDEYLGYLKDVIQEFHLS
jgi:NAD(P)H-dependent FMN reductase